MNFWINSTLPLEGFDGSVRLFPLPNFVMFPGIVKGLHIFEPRYCSMLQEALSTDKLIAMALLKPGWESEYYQRPAIHEVVCIGQVSHHASTPEGTHNILLTGLQRARISSEFHTGFDRFRRAQVNLLEDVDCWSDSGSKAAYQRRLLAGLRSYCPAAHLFSLVAEQSLHDLPLGLLVDLIAQELSLSILAKQQLLAELDVRRRCDFVLSVLGFQTMATDGSSNASSDKASRDDDSYPPTTLWN